MYYGSGCAETHNNRPPQPASRHAQGCTSKTKQVSPRLRCRVAGAGVTAALRSNPARKRSSICGLVMVKRRARLSRPGSDRRPRHACGVSPHAGSRVSGLGEECRMKKLARSTNSANSMRLRERLLNARLRIVPATDGTTRIGVVRGRNCINLFALQAHLRRR